MSGLSLRVLGPVQASMSGQVLSGFRTKKVQALLIYLVSEPEPQQREWLLSLLWPGLPETSARANLRQLIYLLRQTVPKVESGEQAGSEPIIANRQTIQLRPGSVTIDTQEFEELIEGTQSHEHVDLLTCHQCRRDLEQATVLYRGDFLSDFYLEDSNEFEAWAQSRREYYRRRALDALETLATIATRQQAYPEARTYAERQLEIDNLRESAYRQLMEVLALSGHREEALAQYEACKRVLAEELGMAPATRTTQLYEQILAGDLSFDVPLVQGVRGYELKEEIGEGAYGSIHRAVQPAINREVAVKVIQRKLANNPEFIRRFEAEAQTIARLEHPYIVPLYDYWRDPDGAYLVMRYLRGGNLLGALAQGSWEPQPTLQLLEQLASALNAAHQQGVVHRDIKPANILLDEAGNAFLSDFGIAKDLTGEMQMTSEGMVIGTPDYISPEQIRAEPLSPQTDLYSLGLVLYETLTGERPYPDISVANLLYKHLNEPVPLVGSSRPDLPVTIDEVIQRATAKQPADRYANALEMAEAFRRAVQGDGALQTAEPISTTLPAVGEIYNPYKGLRAFQEADAEDFFGREMLVHQLLERLKATGHSQRDAVPPGRFLAVVGPSGSGKSSVVKAGLIPALRQGAVPGSEKWFVAEMVPGSHPLEELEMALWPIAVDPPPSLVEPMERDTRGLLRTIRRIMPDEEGAELLLVVDQFEELFTLVEDEERRKFFLDSLLMALRAPRSPLRVVVTLRADFYDRPLGLQPLGQVIQENTEIVLPLAPEELNWAVRDPARRMGVSLEGGLAEAIVADVADQPGALPLVQYALTELFERRLDNRMTQAAYREIGGVLGALGQRAEELYNGFEPAEQEASRQLFLRLVTLGDGDVENLTAPDTRRRVLRSELEAMQSPAVDSGDDDPASQTPLSQVIEAYGAARLLTFDHDPVTRGPTVEVAHEALLREWSRLRGWLDQSHNDVRMQRLLGQAAAEWTTSRQEPGFLLRDARLDQFAGWAENSTVALTLDEQNYLEASLQARREREAQEQARQQRELETAQQLAESEKSRAEAQSQAAQRLRRRAWFLAGAMFLAIVLAATAFLLGRQANENADLAATREARALSEANQRATAQSRAEIERQRADEQRDAALQAESQAVVAREEAQNEAESRATAEAAAIQEQTKAEEQTRLTRSRELALAALNSLDEDAERSILLALEALSIAHTQEAEQVLHQAVSADRLLLRMENGLQARQLAYSPDGSLLASTAWQGDEQGSTVTVWDATRGEELFALSPDYSVEDVVFSPDGQLVVTAGTSDTRVPVVQLWDASKGQERASLTLFGDEEQPPCQDGSAPGFYGLDINPDGRLLATIQCVDGQYTASVWDIASGQALLDFADYTAPNWQRTITFSQSGDAVAANTSEAIATIWDTVTGEVLFVVSHEGGEITDIAFSPDGRYLVTGGHDGQAIIWDIATGEMVLPIDSGSPEVWAVAFSPDGDLLATGTPDGSTKVWDVVTGQQLMTMNGADERFWGVAFSPEDDRLATTSLAGELLVWDLAPGKEFFAQAGQVGFEKVVMSPDGERIVASDVSGRITIWEAATGRELLAWQAHEGVIEGLGFSPDGQLLATGGADQVVNVWEADTGELLRTFEGHSDYIAHAAFSPDGEQLATAAFDGMVGIWDASSGQSILTRTLDSPVTNVTYDPEGKRLVVTQMGTSSASIIDADSGEKLLVLQDERFVDGTVDAVFSPDGRWVAVSSFGGIVAVFDSQTGEQLLSIDAHNAPIWGLAFSPDGTKLATGSVDGSAKLWDAVTGELQLTLDDHGAAVAGLAFDSSGERLVTASYDNVVRGFILPLDQLLSLAESRLTRTFTGEECRQYRIDPCPAEE